jgi:acetoin utilization protein AcuC
MAVYIGSEIYRRSAFGHNHPLSYARQESVLDMCRVLGWLDESNFIISPTADMSILTRYHDENYVAALKSADIRGSVDINVRKQYNFGTMENPLFKGVFTRASTTVGGSIEAAKQALTGKIAFHPSGGTHHGMKDRAHGFCYFNDPVYAVLTLLDAGLERVLYVDIDAHHGDGVEEAFLDDVRVTTLSVHEENRWPYSGTLEENGKSRINLPVPQGLNDSEFLYIFNNLIRPVCNTIKPQAIVITCGADAIDADPLSKMSLSNQALWQVVMQLKTQTEHLIVLGGGGYNPWTTVRAWVGLWGLLSGNILPKTLPNEAQAILARFDSDLIDEEDRLPEWITRLEDKKTKGDVREEIKRRVNLLTGWR